MLPIDETHALAARARLVARAVVGLVFDEQRAARFVQAYCSAYRRHGIMGEAERKAEFLAAIERESLLLVAARIERTLPQVVACRFSRLAQADATTSFREAYLTFLGGSLAWDIDERDSFRKDLGLYLRLTSREGSVFGSRGGAAPASGAFVDRCAFLIDPSMLAQAREAAGRYQAELESCADEAVHAAFRGLRSRPARARVRPAVPRAPRRRSKRKAKRPRRKTARRRRTRTRGKTAARRKRATRRKGPNRRKARRRRRPARRRLRK